MCFHPFSKQFHHVWRILTIPGRSLLICLGLAAAAETTHFGLLAAEGLALAAMVDVDRWLIYVVNIWLIYG